MADTDVFEDNTQQEADMGSREMPRYRSHKQVWALKIASVTDPNTDPTAETDGSRILSFEDEGYSTIRVDAEYVRKHNPQPGGYYVVYQDGYTSWSPAKSFEEGYTRVSN